MRKKIGLILALCMMISVTGCGKQNDSSSEPEIHINASQETLASKSDSEVSSDAEVEENSPADETIYPVVPAVDVNTDADMSSVTINGVTINLNEAPSLEKVLSDTGLSCDSFGATSVESSFSFHSAMYSLNPQSSDDCTEVSLEVENYDGKIVDSDRLKMEDFGIYKLKGVHASQFFTRSDFNVYFCGVITTGTEKSAVESQLGAGTELDDMIAYNNGTNTLLIEYDTAANIKDYVVFDLETTGLSPDYNEIINIGGLLVQNGVVTQEFNTLVKPRKAIPQEIIQLTGITNEAVQNAPSINVALKSFLEAIGDDTVVLGHNLGFDCRFVSAKKKQVYRSSRAEFTNPYIDTLPLAKSLFRLKSYKLTALSEHFGITHNDAHTALADCYAAYELFCIIQNELSLRKSLLA